jgi:hypothetical protein
MIDTVSDGVVAGREKGSELSNEFEDYARDCLRLAAKTEDEFVRGELIEMAKHWMGIATEEEDRRGTPRAPRFG